jgi:insertion element IS1 protein InsB
LGQSVHCQVTQRTDAQQGQKGRIGRVVYLRRQEKNKIYVLAIVDRDTRCVLSWDVVLERTSEALQACLERAPQAKQYYSDAFPAYDTLYYGAPYEMRTDKQETYSVEAVNADLRHYLKRLARKSRCFSRRMQALAKNIRLFVYCYNHRQLTKRLFPHYPSHLVDFICPLCLGLSKNVSVAHNAELKLVVSIPALPEYYFFLPQEQC